MKSLSKNFVWILIILMFLSAGYSLLSGRFQAREEIALSSLVQQINEGKVEAIAVSDSALDITFKDKKRVRAYKETEAGLTETLRNYGVDPVRLRDVAIMIENPGGGSIFFGLLFPILGPLLLIAFFVWFTARQVQRGSMQAFSFGQSRARLISPEGQKEKITFKDVAGVREAKEELKEIVDFLKNPKKYLDIGAKIPKGVLLMGPPGVGKTYIARAVAGESGVPFFYMSASEFIELFVGVGASVTGDTPVLTREHGQVRLLPIQEVVDMRYMGDAENFVVPVENLEALGMKREEKSFWGVRNTSEKFHFGASQFVSVKGVLRHKVSEIYEVHCRGSVLRMTGDHSIFVREKNYVRAKRADELRKDDVLVGLPYKVRSSFIPGRGTTHHVKAHYFDTVEIPELTIWNDEWAETQRRYEYAFAQAGAMTQKEIGAMVGVSQATIGNWLGNLYMPKFFRSRSIARGLPPKTVVTPELMRLFGYYVAEGRTTRYFTQFVFGSHEKEMHDDCGSLIRNIFSLEPRVEEMRETHSTRISISSRTLAQFFERACGTGSHHKRLPEWIWNVPREYVLEFIKGYARGDGYVTKEGKLIITSVSHTLIRELTWLMSMHGIQVGIKKIVMPAGRIIREKRKPLPESVAWSLIIGKTSNIWGGMPSVKSPNQFKRPKILKIIKKPYSGFVYDLVGCDGEAFFGGEKPMLLHNSRVRDLFRVAKKSAPAIIYVDELDAVGRIRGAGIGGGHDEREQTLNQLLVEMDGIETNDRIIILSSTNRPDILDPALLRPGRFDRRVILDLPDINDREEILKIHTRNKPFARDVNLRTIAERTPGFSGADLANLVNEAAILAAREDRKEVCQADLTRSIEKVMLGPERKSHILSPQEKNISAYHEAGHALVAASVKHVDPVHKISIVSRGRAAGYTLKLPSEDRHLYTRAQFLDELAVSLGGYAAEKIVFNELTTGAGDDLRKATDLARSLVTRFGMSEKVGPMVLGDREEMVFLGREIATERNYSEETARVIDQEIKRLMDEAYDRAQEIVARRRAKLDQIASLLIEKESIEREEFEQLMKDVGQ